LLNDEEKQRNAMARSRKANELLSNEAFTHVVESMKKEVFKKWQSTTDPAERDRCWVAVNLIDRIVDGLGAAVQNGKFASAALEKILADKARKAA
jgi:hypothetical protein